MTVLVSRRYDEPDVLRTVYSTESYTCGPPYSPFSHTEIARRRKGSYSGVKTPFWKRMIADGKIVPYQHYARYDEISSQSGRRRLVWKIQTGCYRTAVIASCGILEDFALFPSETELYRYVDSYGSTAERLLQTVASDIRADFDPLTFLAELKQVKSMFLSLGPRLVRQLLRKPTDKAAADVWLQWQMGWKPFISDLNDITDIIKEPKGAIRSKKNRKTSDKFVVPITYTKFLPNGESHTITGSTRVSLEINASIVADVSALMANVTFNPIQTVWELIPYSFLIDYFIGIGNWISANSLVLSGVEYTACVGFDVTLERDVKLTGKPPATGALVEYSAIGDASAKARLKLRTPRRISLLNLPPLNFETQSITRMLNMLALAVQRR